MDRRQRRDCLSCPGLLARSTVAVITRYAKRESSEIRTWFRGAPADASAGPRQRSSRRMSSTGSHTQSFHRSAAMCPLNLILAVNQSPAQWQAQRTSLGRRARLRSSQMSRLRLSTRSRRLRRNFPHFASVDLGGVCNGTSSRRPRPVSTEGLAESTWQPIELATNGDPATASFHTRPSASGHSAGTHAHQHCTHCHQRPRV
jgi:hypothetical protein